MDSPPAPHDADAADGSTPGGGAGSLASAGRRCTRCGVSKPASEFHRHARGRDGRASRCRECEAARFKAYRHANAERIRAQSRAWYGANREQQRARNRAYARTHADPIRARVRAWRRAHPEKRRAWARRNYGANEEKAWAANLRRMFQTTPEWYYSKLAEQGGVCAICGGMETAIDPRRGKVKRLAVDHDHRCCPGERSCGRCLVGLLCARCNTGSSLFRDDPVLLRTAAAYRERGAV